MAHKTPQRPKPKQKMSLWERFDHYVIKGEPIDISHGRFDEDEDDDGEFRLKPGWTIKV